MREIKFRYYDKREKKMITFNFGNLSGGSVYPDMETVMQYTGFVDEDGKEIYEGDIHFCEEDPYEGVVKGIVTWDAELGYCYLKLAWEEEISRERLPIASYAVCGRVIGNIYENADMLPLKLQSTESA